MEMSTRFAASSGVTRMRSLLPFCRAATQIAKEADKTKSARYPATLGTRMSRLASQKNFLLYISKTDRFGPFGWAKCPVMLSRSNLFRHNIRCAIAAAQETIGFLIPNDLLLRGIESQRAPQTVRGIG